TLGVSGPGGRVLYLVTQRQSSEAGLGSAPAQNPTGRYDSPGRIRLMPRLVIFGLFNTLVDSADDERGQVIAEMALMVDVAPAALIAAYHDSWRDRLVRWDVEETVRILARSLGANPTERQ